jgi:hypothetical protein
MYQYRQIIHRMRMGESDRTIAKTRLAGRIKCAEIRSIAEPHGWLAEAPLPDDEALATVFEKAQDPNPTHQSLSADHEAQIRVWVRDEVCMTTIHQTLVDKFHFSGSYSSVRRLVQKLNLHAGKVTCILDFAPGEAAQIDFGKGPDITDVFTGKEMKTWIFVMTLCFSRHMYAEIVRDQKVATLLACHRRALEFFGGVPSKLIIDNAKCAVVRACSHEPEVQRSYGELAEGYGFLISPCPPRDPQKKTCGERGKVRKEEPPCRQDLRQSDRLQPTGAAVARRHGERPHPRDDESPPPGRIAADGAGGPHPPARHRLRHPHHPCREEHLPGTGRLRHQPLQRPAVPCRHVPDPQGGRSVRLRL